MEEIDTPGERSYSAAQQQTQSRTNVQGAGVERGAHISRQIFLKYWICVEICICEDKENRYEAAKLPSIQGAC